MNVKLCRILVIVLGILIVLIHTKEPALALPKPVLNSYKYSSDSAELTPTESEIYSMVQQAREAWINSNAESFASLFTPNGEFLVPGNRWVGRDAIRQVLADFATYSLGVTIEIHRIIVDGNQAAVEWSWEDVDSSGDRHPADDAIVIDFEDGRIRRWREYIDKQTPQL